ncbi:MAG: bifunctional proline dehydrogenase/L-glutamate gamma-semialdehyde dehydrogenase PutA [Pseudomonadota bacterium]
MSFVTVSEPIRSAIRAHCYAPEAPLVAGLVAQADLGDGARAQVSKVAADLVRHVRVANRPSMMESFLSEYGLSTDEGIGLMCLAEALLRVPDAHTIDELISDKIEPGNWEAHLGKSSSSLVNAATWALLLTGRVLDEHAASAFTPIGALRGLVRRVGEPVVRVAVGQAMRILGEQFVLGETIEEGVKNARAYEAQGYTYSYDMLGEAARTAEDAERYFQAYTHAIATAGAAATGDIATSPGVSIKLSALHPRYEWSQRRRVFDELVPRVRELAEQAARLGIGLNIDAEEANRLELSLGVIERVLSTPTLAGWDGFGIVVQAYGRRAPFVIDWIAALADHLDRRVMVRLVKGAYWDTEIKQAQVLGLPDFPVFTRKAHTDVCYLACARKMIARSDRIYAQFATHNAHTTAAILAMQPTATRYEFQRLHGMGEALHEALRVKNQTRCRIYAPVGAHEDLLAYLVRRLLENGANSSFVNQIVDDDVTPEEIARDPIDEIRDADGPSPHPGIRKPPHLFGPDRNNAIGFDINEPASVYQLIDQRRTFEQATWHAGPTFTERAAPARPAETMQNPALPSDTVGAVTVATAADIDGAIANALAAFNTTETMADRVARRADALRRAADAYEAATAEFAAITAREAGKSLLDAIAEVREAVDFLRYYANEAERLVATDTRRARGVIACISPWNFPLAIFTGQISAALAAGNSVIAKPAEQTPLIAAKATALLHEAGIERDALTLLPGDGPNVGAPLTAHPDIAGVCFTGSTEVAQAINRTLAETDRPDPLLIAETGGLNAMIVDSTALPEQAVRDILASAFQSAGQRCSALRVLYVQSDIADNLLTMLYGAMDELRIGDPWDPAIDIGPVIDAEAKASIEAAIEEARADGRVLKQIRLPDGADGADGRGGLFVSPTVLKVSGIADVPREIFGPVLHVATFDANDIDRVIGEINARGYGLTFGLHTRIDDRVEAIVSAVCCGNIYVNRNQIGAIVGSQPFGGEGLSGTGPKAGGPDYVARFFQHEPMLSRSHAEPRSAEVSTATPIDWPDAQAWVATDNRTDQLVAILGDRVDASLISRVRLLERESRSVKELPGPTGETNRLTAVPTGNVTCLGPDEETIIAQAMLALATGNATLVDRIFPKELATNLAAVGAPIVRVPSQLTPMHLSEVGGLTAVLTASNDPQAKAARKSLAARTGPIVPLIVGWPHASELTLERHLCVDTTAAGGNAALLASTDAA